MKRLAFLVFFIVCLFSNIDAQLTSYQAAITSSYIFNFSKTITWTQRTQTNFTIGVYGTEPNLVTVLEQQAQIMKVKNRAVTIKNFKSLRQIEAVDILYVSINNNSSVTRIYEAVQGKQVVVITENIPNDSYSMINFKTLKKGKREFTINKTNLTKEKLIYSDQLVAHGGDKSDLKDLYGKTEEALEKKRQELAKKEDQLYNQSIELNKQIFQNEKQRQENKQQREKNNRQESLLVEKQTQIDSQTFVLTKLQTVLQQRKDSLILKDDALNQREIELKEQKSYIEKQEITLNEREKEINSRDKTINTQNKQIRTISSTLETQQGFLLFMGSIILIIAVLLFFIYKSYKQKKIINEKLKENNIAISKQNAEIQQQKEEIMAQSEQLSITNKELEKLSIVASETQNAVIIMDPTGKFEWINVGFTRMYGYTLQLLRHEKDEFLPRVSKNSQINEILQACVESQESVVYEAMNESRTGEKKWVQTTLSPIIGDDGKVSKLVAIDTDISKLKAAEEEIMAQNKKIRQQADVLAKTNKELEKLSIVASETDNAIIIMDDQGNFEWINAAFSRLFEYTLDQLISEVSPNIIGNKTDKEITTLINHAIKDKESVEYDFQGKSRSGKKIWVHTTLTPILSPDGEISKLVAIDSDIRRVKEAEAEIRRQSEELMTQRDELSYQKQEIERKNTHIESGIKYALTIQKAILPLKENLDQHINSFIIFKPKDIVSGDFYWYSAPVTNQTSQCDSLFLAAVDCTGHGVPGAFMSMIGNRLLNEIVNERKVREPNMILDKLNEGVRLALKQEQTDNNDGMDVSLCRIDNKCENEITITFAGAKRPIIYYSNKTKQIEQIKGDRKTIGGVRVKRNVVQFTNKQITLHKNDMIYLTSDGLIDQNSSDRKRYGTTRFIDLLSTIATKSLEEQEQKILQSLESFQEGEEQRDDITIIGVKL